MHTIHTIYSGDLSELRTPQYQHVTPYHLIAVTKMQIPIITTPTTNLAEATVLSKQENSIVILDILPKENALRAAILSASL